MFRRSVPALFNMGHRIDTGVWTEDFLNDYVSAKYHSSRQRMRWYYTNDVDEANRNVQRRQKTMSAYNDAGLNPATGYGPFERELERTGVPVEKYPLPSTTAVRRLSEAVLLRRQELEKKSERLLAGQREKLKQPRPSEWYDETNGPLNVNFLARYAQQSYEEGIADLPRRPIRHSDTADKAQTGK
jgi:hypothetical protein